MLASNWTGQSDERLRLEALAAFDILDTGPEAQFEDLIQLASEICAVPMAVITFIDEHRQWFKARIGIDAEQTDRDIAFCEHVVQGREMFVVQDARADPRFADNPLVRGEPWIRFYAGAPLITKDGFVLGSLGVLDRVPRTLAPLQRRSLSVLAHQVVAQLELRKSLTDLGSLLAERERAQQALRNSHNELERKVRARTADLRNLNATLKSEAARTAREAAFSQAIIDSLPGIVYILDGDMRFVRWNRNLETVTGYRKEEITRAAPADFFSGEHARELVSERLKRVLCGERVMMEADLVARDGRRIPYYFTGERIELDQRACVCGVGFDISERRQAEEALRLRDRALQASVNAILITDLECRIEYANPAFERITGYSVAEAIGRTPGFLQREDDNQAGVAAMNSAVARRSEGSALVRNYRKDGEPFWNDVHIAPVRDANGAVTHFVGVLNDVTEIKRYQRELELHANVDALTALDSRKMLHDRLRLALVAAQRSGARVAVGFIDLDNFKFINESLGHGVGDALLKQVAERLLECLDGAGTVARYGGDEFAFVLTVKEDEKSVSVLVERVLRTVDRAFQVGAHKLFVSCSIGLSFYPQDGNDVETLLRNADAAMHLAKESGRNNFKFYTPAMSKRATDRLSMEAKLRQALTNNEFVLHYQPKLELSSGIINGAEALLRWYPHDMRAPAVPPDVFIPLAEETGLINAIGEWVLVTACSHAKAMQDMGLEAVRMSVNLSARQFEPQTIVQAVGQALATSGLDARFLELELTESVVMRHPQEAIAVLSKLKDMGLHLSIDDFGTGYSSLSYLQRFPVDLLKIDQSFVRDIGADPNDAIIARAVISLGHSLGMSVIAEGVSSREQLAFLRENGCDEIQGFLLSRPLPFEELVSFMRAHDRPALH